MDLTNLINEEVISLSLEANTREEAIEQMAKIMDDAGFITNVSQYVEAVKEREEKGSTGVGFGIAIPHGKSNGVKKPVLGFAKLAYPIEWQSLDGNPVNMFFMIGVPEEQAGNEHLKILSSISRKLIHEDFRNQLINSQNSNEVIAILKGI